ncbi:MAG: hypothetical protein ACOCV2_02215 [Persicimonas sp.]
MSLVNFPVERRRKRSNRAHAAMTYQLEHVFEQQDLTHLALGDASGLLLASAGEADEATTLVAYAPVLSTRQGASRREMLGQLRSHLPHIDADNLSIRRFRVDGQDLFLCCVADESAARQASLYRTVTGIRRILKQTAAA